MIRKMIRHLRGSVEGRFEEAEGGQDGQGDLAGSLLGKYYIFSK